MPLADLVSRRVPFGEAGRAYRLVEEHPDEVLGVLLDYGNAAGP
jgi:hypothetical protein